MLHQTTLQCDRNKSGYDHCENILLWYDGSFKIDELLMPTLHWLDKEKSIKKSSQVPFRLLELGKQLSYGDSDTENMLIQGDNLEALKALLPFYAGKVKCIFIDPPYNTKSAFEHYDDNLEHSQWLNMMYPRLELLRELLAENGSIWVTIDDNEGHYLKVIMDEVFGRRNFIIDIAWNSRKSKQNDTLISLAHNYVMLYAKNKPLIKINRIPINCSKFSNPDDDPRGAWVADPFDAPNIRPNLTYPIINPNNGRA